MPEFTEPVEFNPHPNELAKAVDGQHAVRFRYDDREYPVTFRIQGDPDHSEWAPETEDGELNWTGIALTRAQANEALESADGVTVETDDLLLVIQAEYEAVNSDTMCRVDDCLFYCKKHHDGTLTCPAHGEQVVPEYETENDPPETEATGLGDFA